MKYVKYVKCVIHVIHVKHVKYVSRCLARREVRNQIPDGLGKLEQRTNSSRLEVVMRNHVAPTERMHMEAKQVVGPQVGTGKYHCW